MFLRQRQDQIRFQRPVWRAWRVVILTHRQVGIGKTERQDAVPIVDRLPLPPAKMAQNDAFHDARREHLKAGKSDGAPERHHCKTIGQAAAKGD
ncbi:hypothetical protein D3C87_1948760 [compost metagenome]